MPTAAAIYGFVPTTRQLYTGTPWLIKRITTSVNIRNLKSMYALPLPPIFWKIVSNAYGFHFHTREW